MDSATGKIKSNQYNNEPIVRGNQRVWFLNNDLVRVHHFSRSQGLVSLYNINKDRLESCLLSDFKKNREKAYSVLETSKLVNRHRKYMPRLVSNGVIPKARGSQKGGGTGWQVRSYYSESQVKEIRATLASIHIGQPRRDGRVTNNSVPNSQELTRRMGTGMLVYTKTDDGRFIAVWSETI